MLGELVRTILSPRVLALWFLGAVVMAVTGPFGTYLSLDLGARFLYWAGVVGLALVTGLATFAGIDRCCAARSAWQRHLVATAIFTAIFLPILRGLLLALHAEGGPHVMGLWHMALVIAMVPLSVGLVKYFWLAHEAASTAAPAPAPALAPPAAQPRLLDRIDPALRGEVLHLTVRDHYVDVLTDKGESSLLMRFADAIAELDGVEGMQVHRSHWVARAAVTGGARAGGKTYLTLAGGRRVPVSRGFLAEVQAKGYF